MADGASVTGAQIVLALRDSCVSLILFDCSTGSQKPFRTSFEVWGKAQSQALAALRRQKQREAALAVRRRQRQARKIEEEEKGLR